MISAAIQAIWHSPSRSTPTRPRRSPRSSCVTCSTGRPSCDDAGPAAGADPARGKPAPTERAKAETRLGQRLVAPAIVLMLLVTAFPMIRALYLSLFSYSLAATRRLPAFCVALTKAVAPPDMTYATRVARYVDASPAAVYRVLVDPDAVARWRVPEGMTAQVHHLDAREGGTSRVSLTYDGAGEGKSAVAPTPTAAWSAPSSPAVGSSRSSSSRPTTPRSRA